MFDMMTVFKCQQRHAYYVDCGGLTWYRR